MGRIAALRREWEDAIYYYQCCLDADPGFADARDRLLHTERSSAALGTRLRFIPLPPARPVPPVVTYVEPKETP